MTDNELHKIANLFGKGKDTEAKKMFLGYYEYLIRYTPGGHEVECYCGHCESDFSADNVDDLTCPDCGKLGEMTE